MRRRGIGSWIGFAALLAAAMPSDASAATLGELADWCTPESGSERLCDAYLDTIFQGLASPDPVLNGGHRACVPPDADRTEIIRLVRAHAAQSGAAKTTAAIDGVGAALEGRFPCH
jgi:hypothetical protein